MTLHGRTLDDLARALASGETSSRALVETALDAIAAHPGAFTLVDAHSARTTADDLDRRRSEGHAASAYAGVPISVKDLFDVEGQTTAAGSLVLRDAAPAKADAPTVARLRQAGLVVIGRTHMSEFAFTGLGLNPHFPLLENPRDPGRAPGGSSSGAAASVALGQSAAGLGTDTGGSVRIPAAFCGLTGFKPTQRRISRRGALPLSTTLDSIGPIARSVGCCRVLDAILADDPGEDHPPADIRGLRLGVPRQIVLDDLEEEVAAAFDRTLSRLRAAGAEVQSVDLPALDRMVSLFARGSLSNAESFAWHRRQGLLERRSLYDPNVLARIEIGAAMSCADYLDLVAEREALIADADIRTRAYDALICPTAPIRPPRLEAIASPAAFARLNALALRNTSAFNVLDRCAASLPMTSPEDPPAGLMIIGETLGDARLLAVAEAVQTALL